MTTTRWTKEQLKLAFHLYCQPPFGKLDMRTPSGMLGKGELIEGAIQQAAQCGRQFMGI